MSVLVYLAEDYHRNALRRLVTETLSFHKFIEAQSVENSIDLLTAYRESLSLIISDDLSFISYLNENPSLDTVPLIFIGESNQLNSETAQLNYPFGATKLKHAVYEALIKKSKRRNEVLVFSKNQAKQWTDLAKNYENIKLINNRDDLKIFLNHSMAKVSAMIVYGDECDQDVADLIKQFKTTREGCHIDIYAIGNKATDFFAIRTLVRRTVFDLSNNLEKAKLIEEIINRKYLLTKYLFGQMKRSFIEKKYSRSQKLAYEILSYNSKIYEANAILGNIFLKKKKFNKAEKEFHKIIHANACYPQGYLKIIKLYQMTKNKLAAQYFQRAQEFCPNFNDFEAKEDYKVAA